MFINRDLSYPYLTSAGDLCERFFWKRLCINVLFGNINRNIRQVFLWGINTLTFPPKVWGAEPTPHSPPSREGSGGGGFGREPTPHSPPSREGSGGGGWGREPTPHSPPSREGSGGGGFGREPTPHCRVIYSYIHIFLLKRAPHCLFKICILKRAPHCRFVQ